MTVLSGLVLGAVQGLTEFLPVSSSGHTVLMAYLFKMGTPGTMFEIALHLGTLLAVLIFFWSDWVNILRGKDWPLLRSLFITTLVTGVIAVLVGDSRVTAEVPLVVAINLAVFGLLLWWVDARTATNNQKLSWGQDIVLGLAQGLALIPGVSRSGILITTARGFKLDRERAARHAFLLSAPIIALTPLSLVTKLVPTDRLDLTVVVAALTAAAVGWFTIKWMLALVKNISYQWFAIYRLALAVVIVLFIVL